MLISVVVVVTILIIPSHYVDARAETWTDDNKSKFMLFLSDWHFENDFTLTINPK